ncbi:MAG: hypothetical protein IJN64_10490 [Lachnospiraceae bacterium]|nr:hypothetical protein [Lachnospiraceae bacterium]
MQNGKVKLITPFLMLFAGALASIIMFVKKYDLYTMLWVLLIVLIVFYVIGDVARYLYMSVRPRVLPQGEIEDMITMLNSGVMEKDTEENEEDVLTDEEEFQEESLEFDTDEEYSMDEESVEEYTDENLDEM